MRIIKIISQNRRDFWADMECEGCGNVDHDICGYDDDFFHNEVMPNMRKCSKCGKTRQELGIVGENMKPKYPAGLQL